MRSHGDPAASVDLADSFCLRIERSPSVEQMFTASLRLELAGPCFWDSELVDAHGPSSVGLGFERWFEAEGAARLRSALTALPSGARLFVQPGASCLELHRLPWEQLVQGELQVVRLPAVMRPAAKRPPVDRAVEVLVVRGRSSCRSELAAIAESIRTIWRKALGPRKVRVRVTSGSVSDLAFLAKVRAGVTIVHWLGQILALRGPGEPVLLLPRFRVRMGDFLRSLAAVQPLAVVLTPEAVPSTSGQPAWLFPTLPLTASSAADHVFCASPIWSTAQIRLFADAVHDALATGEPVSRSLDIARSHLGPAGLEVSHWMATSTNPALERSSLDLGAYASTCRDGDPWQSQELRRPELAETAVLPRLGRRVRRFVFADPLTGDGAASAHPHEVGGSVEEVPLDTVLREPRRWLVRIGRGQGKTFLLQSLAQRALGLGLVPLYVSGPPPVGGAASALLQRWSEGRVRERHRVPTGSPLTREQEKERDANCRRLEQWNVAGRVVALVDDLEQPCDVVGMPATTLVATCDPMAFPEGVPGFVELFVQPHEPAEIEEIVRSRNSHAVANRVLEAIRNDPLLVAIGSDLALCELLCLGAGTGMRHTAGSHSLVLEAVEKLVERAAALAAPEGAGEAACRRLELWCALEGLAGWSAWDSSEALPDASRVRARIAESLQASGFAVDPATVLDRLLRIRLLVTSRRGLRFCHPWIRCALHGDQLAVSGEPDLSALVARCVERPDEDITMTAFTAAWCTDLPRFWALLELVLPSRESSAAVAARRMWLGALCVSALHAEHVGSDPWVEALRSANAAIGKRLCAIWPSPGEVVHGVTSLPQLGAAFSVLTRLAGLDGDGLGAPERLMLLALREGTEEEREDAARAVGILGGPAAAEALWRLATDRAETASLRCAAVRAISQLPRRIASRHLLELLTSRQHEARVLAAAARALGSTSVSIPTSVHEVTARVVAAFGLADDRSQAATLALRDLAADTTQAESVRIAAIEALAGSRVGEVRTFVRDLLANDSELESSRMAAAETIGRQPSPEATSALVRALQDETSPIRVRCAAGLALRHAAETEAIDLVTSLAKSPHLPLVVRDALLAARAAMPAAETSTRQTDSPV